MRNMKSWATYIGIVGLVFGPFFYSSSVNAAQLLSRSITIGSAVPGANTSHRFNFDLITVGVIGSIQFEYCENSPQISAPCTPPTGINLSGATLVAQTGATGFSVDAATDADSILISRPPAANAAVPVSYRFTNVINHSTENHPVFVKITTYPTVDGSGAYNDDGSVAYSTSAPITVSAFVPPYLTFCVGVTVSTNCTSASGQLLSFGELSTNATKAVTSQFAGATNDPGGYSTTLTGLTMTSGTNVIPGLGAPTPSQLGISQFGMNLRSNSVPAIGANKNGIGSANPTSSFNQPNMYTFENSVVASSNKSTNFNRFTASYVVNVASNQKPGIYNTTLTYIASAAF